MNFTRPTFWLLLASPALAQGQYDNEVKIQPPLPHFDTELKSEVWIPPLKPDSSPADNWHLSPLERSALDASFDQMRSPRQSSFGAAEDKGAPDAAVLQENVLDMARPPWQQHFQLDEPGDGNLWVFGGTYKARFNSEGAQYVPFLGGDAPRNFPVNFRLSSITLDGQALDFDPSAAPAFVGDAAVFERNGVQERYELRVGQIEQLFVFETLPGRGELVVRMQVDSELTGQQTASGLEFRGEYGTVKYGLATVLDAAGKSASAATSLVAGGIEIRVSPEFLDAAVLPLTIDPIVSTFSINSGSSDDSLPDVAFDYDTFRFHVCWQRRFSSGDRDVWSELRSSTGVLISGSGAYIDFTSADWTNPRTANNRIASQFLTVAERGANPDTDIYGRTRQANSNSMGLQFQISTGSGDKRYPDVGGDPHTAGPTYYCVAWERVWNVATDHDIHARLVRSNSTLLGSSAVMVDNSGSTYDKYPSVSNSNGIPSAATQEWNIVWQRQYNSSDWDIRGAQVHWSGSITESSFSVDFSARNDWYPAASSPLDYQEDGPRVWMAVYRRDNFGDYDIEATAWKGATYINDRTLSDLGSGSGQDQFEPDIDTNGKHFAVSWNEYFGSSTVDRDVFVGGFYIAGDDIHASESHLNMAFSIDPEFQIRGCARHSGGLTSDWIMFVWRDGILGEGDIEGAVYELPDHYGSAVGNTYCSQSSTNSAGLRAEIHATGSAIAGGEPLNIEAFNMPLNKFGNFNCTPNGTSTINPATAQGTFCLGLPYGRLNAPSQIGFTGSTGRFNIDLDTTNLPMNPSVAAFAGQTWRFQAWYRDNNPFSTSNFSEATRIVFH